MLRISAAIWVLELTPERRLTSEATCQSGEFWHWRSNREVYTFGSRARSAQKVLARWIFRQSQIWKHHLSSNPICFGHPPWDGLGFEPQHPDVVSGNATTRGRAPNTGTFDLVPKMEINLGWEICRQDVVSIQVAFGMCFEHQTEPSVEAPASLPSLQQGQFMARGFALSISIWKKNCLALSGVDNPTCTHLILHGFDRTCRLASLTAAHPAHWWWWASYSTIAGDKPWYILFFHPVPSEAKTEKNNMFLPFDCIVYI